MKYEITNEQVENIMKIISNVALKDGYPILQILQSLKKIDNGKSGNIK